MRRKLTVISALLLAIMLSFSMIQPTYAASSKKPAAPKITSATVSGNSITITWKKAKNAKKYEVAERLNKKIWVKYKTVKKTKKNKKKYTKANKYKVMTKGKKYIVYKYDYSYSIRTELSSKKRRVTLNALTGNTYYTFAVRSVNGKKHSAWKPVTRKTGPMSERMTINGKPFVIVQGQKVTIPAPTFKGIFEGKLSQIQKKTFDIIPGNNGYDDIYFDDESGWVMVHGKDTSGYYAGYSYLPDIYFNWYRQKYITRDDWNKYGYISYGGSVDNLAKPSELNIYINDPNMKAVWTLDGTEPQYNQADKVISASDYPFGKWTKGNTIRVHGSTTKSCNVPEAKGEADALWIKLYYKDTVIEEMIHIKMG